MSKGDSQSRRCSDSTILAGVEVSTTFAEVEAECIIRSGGTEWLFSATNYSSMTAWVFGHAGTKEGLLVFGEDGDAFAVSVMSFRPARPVPGRNRGTTKLHRERVRPTGGSSGEGIAEETVSVAVKVDLTADRETVATTAEAALTLTPGVAT